MFVQNGRRADREHRPPPDKCKPREEQGEEVTRKRTYHQKQKYLHDMHSILRIGETSGPTASPPSLVRPGTRLQETDPQLDFGQKFNGLEIVRGVKYGAGQFLYCPGQAETVRKFPPYPFTLQDTALRGAA
jgi:hypothetical protein